METFIVVAVLAAGAYFIYRKVRGDKAKGGGSSKKDPTRPQHPDY